MAGRMLKDADPSFFNTAHPGVETFFRIVAVIEGITVDKIHRVYPVGFGFVKVPLDSVREPLCGIRYLRADDFTVQIFIEPFLFFLSPCPVAYTEHRSPDDLFDVFGEKFKVSKSLVYSYVKAVIVTEIHRLQVYLGEELVDLFEYQLTAGKGV